MKTKQHYTDKLNEFIEEIAKIEKMSLAQVQVTYNVDSQEEIIEILNEEIEIIENFIEENEYLFEEEDNLREKEYWAEMQY